MTDSTAKSWDSVCELTGKAMDALSEVEAALMPVGDNLGPIEFRTLLWARCSLASLYGIRADETVTDAVALADLPMPPVDGSWIAALLSD